ncbi:ketopantoate reductase family protein [Brevibacillus sedimenti]|uniref:ketopantoate reductase family protein n=1 Tax=Brevibacillus sedimenti TaxID=2613334 RepID=UPI001E395880|nr:2-dehydropantoate 2-reductase [Anoxybacillus sediminis]UFJ61203.1 2-dehydropantoate 2-reductase [Anoxybacillus sediminis]
MQSEAITFHPVVIGGGSVGLLYAARFLLNGQSVELVTRTREQAALIGDRGLSLYTLDGRRETVAVNASPIDDGLPEGDLYLLAVKQTAIAELLPLLRQLPRSARVLALQNGMGHHEQLAEGLEPGQHFYAINTEGARRLSPFEVEHTGTGLLRVGPWTAEPVRDPLIAAFVAWANRCGIRAEYVDAVEPYAWRKLLANALINPLTALFEIPNGMLLDSPHTLRLMRELFDEAAAVANRCGQKIDEADWQEIVSICRNTSRNLSSMLQDIRRHHRTEVDAINGYLVDTGKRTGTPVPLHETLLRAVHLKSGMETAKGEAAHDRFG